MLDKSAIKQFVHDAIHLFRGVAAKLAKDYGKTRFWVSDLLAESSETDGFVFGYLQFMDRVNEEAPEACAMIDDYVRGVMDGMRAKGLKVSANEPLDTLVEQSGVARQKFETAWRNRVGRGDLKALAAKMCAQDNNLMQALDPPRPMLLGEEKERRAK